jgi:hypothetical protein
MMNFIPIFPLALVVYPGEALNLHIFEPRYKQLVRDCMQGAKTFGIPSVVQEKVGEMGTLVEIVEVTKTYDNGEMDIKTKGARVFKVLEWMPKSEERLYDAAIVEYPSNDMAGSPALTNNLLEGLRRMHNLLELGKKLPETREDTLCYDFAHMAGLSLEQEYELLCLLKESQRQEYLRRHLKRVLPVVAEMEALKKKAKLNGHFKNLSGFNLDAGTGK